jgi:membrane protein
MPSFEKGYEAIKTFIFNSLMPSQSEIISEYIDKFLGNTLQMGVFGLITVLAVSMMFFKDYETIFNKIMHTSVRPFWQSLSAYWTLVTLTPILLGISFYLSNILQNFLDSQGYNINFLAIFPYLLVWALFFTIYMISSNAKISLYTGGISSFISSFIWYISKALFVFYVTYNKTYLTIYGSFSIVLFFFVWIYCSWIIFLYGIKICYILHSREQKKEIANTDNSDKNHKNRSISAKSSENEVNN